MTELAAAAVLIASGMATSYAPGVMDRVVKNRVQFGHIDGSLDVRGYVALLDAEHIGRLVWIESPDGKIIGPVMVADCAAQHDYDRLVKKGFAVDLSYELAQELGVVDAPVRGFLVWSKKPMSSVFLLVT